MAIVSVLILVERIIWAKDKLTAWRFACEVVDVIFSVLVRDVRTPQCFAASAAQQVKPPEEICLAEEDVVKMEELARNLCLAILDVVSAKARVWSSVVWVKAEDVPRM